MTFPKLFHVMAQKENNNNNNSYEHQTRLLMAQRGSHDPRSPSHPEAENIDTLTPLLSICDPVSVQSDLKDVVI